jgi:hypothetical protein
VVWHVVKRRPSETNTTTTTTNIDNKRQFDKRALQSEEETKHSADAKSHEIGHCKQNLLRLYAHVAVCFQANVDIAFVGLVVIVLFGIAYCAFDCLLNDFDKNNDQRANATIGVTGNTMSKSPNGMSRNYKKKKKKKKKKRVTTETININCISFAQTAVKKK